jgi:peptide/nickel transport system substrate-binding protein
MNRADLFGDQKVRQALSYAIDRDALVQSLLQGEGKIATGPIIPEIEWAYNPDVKRYDYDPEMARSLLAEAGWTETDDGWEKDGLALEFTLSAFTGNATVEQTAVLVQQYFADIGVRANIEVLEFSTFVTDVRDNRSADGYYSFISYMTPEPEPDGIYAYFHSSNAERGSNFTAYSNPEVDELLDTGRESTDQETRRNAYFKVQEILAEDQTRIFLFYPPANLVRNERLQGLPANDSYYHLADASWAE